MKKYLVFDVESAGLMGKGFAFGYVVVLEDGTEIESGVQSAGIDSVICSPEDKIWLEANLPHEILYPKDQDRVSLDLLRKCFLGVLEANQDAEVVVDCGYPVESGWLLEIGAKVYPLHELATALKMSGNDPTGHYPRLANEAPAHHPLYDARQTARLWLEALRDVSMVKMKPGREPGV